MTAKLWSLASLPMVPAFLDLDIDGWLVSSEVRTTVASLLAALLSAIANVFMAGFFSS